MQDSNIPKDDDSRFNEMQTVKRRLFAMRNGIIADTLRRAGSPYRMIFGVNLPQLRDIAADTPHSADLARRLWQNTATRESMLIAPMLIPPDNVTPDDAFEMMTTCFSTEAADVLCLRLLRQLPYATDLIDRAIKSDDDLTRYCALRLMCNLLSNYPAKAQALAQAELLRQCALTSSLARMIIATLDDASEGEV